MVNSLGDSEAGVCKKSCLPDPFPAQDLESTRQGVQPSSLYQLCEFLVFPAETQSFTSSLGSWKGQHLG